MQTVSLKRHRFLPEVIWQAVWLYFRFTLSFQDVEEMLGARVIKTKLPRNRMAEDTVGISIIPNRGSK